MTQPCECCGCNEVTKTDRIVIGSFPTPQEVLAVNCARCGNLLYGYCKPLEEEAKEA